MSISTEAGTVNWETFDSFMGETPTGVRFVIVHEVRSTRKDDTRCHRVRVEQCPRGWPSAQTFSGANSWMKAQAFMDDLKDFLLWSEHPDECGC